MGILLQKLSFQKTLDQDTSPENLDPQSYVDARNVQPLTNNTESTTSHIPVLGNTEAFDLGSVVVQNKTWRIHSPQDATDNLGGIFLYDQNGNLFPTISGQVQPMEWNRNQTVANQAVAILAMFTTIDGSGTTSVIAVGDYIDITTNTINGYDLGSDARTASHGTPILITDISLDPQVTVEAYDTSLAGELNDIGAKDLLGDLFILSTPQKNLPQALTYYSNGTISVNVITDVVASGGRYSVTTAQPHGLSTGMKVIINGVVYTGTPVVSPNGIWIITSTGSLTFTCQEWYTVTTGYTAWTSGGIITLYTESIGEIGVAQKDVNTAVWTYTRLLRTKQWNFRTSKQPDFRVAERTSIKDSLYWTNNYEPPRCFYYNRPLNGIFVDAFYSGTTDTGDRDGAIMQINPHGHYSYLTVAEETKLLLSPTGIQIQFTDQPQSGGQVASGNWRYSIRGVSDSLAFTEWLDLTNPVNVYSAADNGNPALIIGDLPGTITPKINNLQITGIIPGLFKYIELAGINYVGNAIEGFVIKRVLLDGVSTTLDISHTGTETGVANLDLGTLNTKFEPIETAKSMNVIDSRMILSNVTLSQQKDFTALAQTITYGVYRTALTAVRSATSGTIVMGEYQDPTNVNMFCGYMHNETYRLAAKFRMKKGGFWTDDFWVDDIKIDCTTSGRKLAALTDFNLTDNTSGGADDILFSAYIGFNINSAILDYLIDGVKVRDLVDAISFERAEVVPTILATGVGILGVSGVVATTGEAIESGFDAAGGADTFRISTNVVIGVTDPNIVMEFPFASGRTYGGALGPNPAYNLFPFGGGFDKYNQRREYASFYSPDIQFNHTSISYQGGDVIINFGNPAFIQFVNGINSDSKRCNSNYAEYSGRTNKNNAGATDPDIVTLTDVMLISKGNSGILPIAGTQTFNKYSRLSRDSDNTQGTASNPTGLVFLANGAPNFNNPASLYFLPTDHGIYYMQYYRALSDQYGDKTLTKYVSTGHILEIDSKTGNSTESVYGGDTFTQANFLRHRFADTIDNGFGGGLMFYSQNRINAQMKEKGPGQIANLYPALATDTWLETQTVTNEVYQEGYTIRNQVRSDIAFDPNTEQINVLPATFFYSGIKILDSPQDGYRSILPLNRHDLDITYGEITHHESFNGELFAIQQLKVEREFFNTRGQMKSDPTLSIVIGDATVMSRDGLTVTNYGSSHKWSVVKGRSIGGNDTLYWIDIFSKKVFRLASDGTLSLSDIKGMKSFFANNLQWVVGKDTPANGTGISSVWHDKFSQAIWTVRGHRITPLIWIHGAAFSITTTIGDLFYYHPIPIPSPAFVYSSFEQTGELFISKFTGSHNFDPVAVYPLPNVVSTLTGTTTLTITTASPHLLVSGDQVKFRSISGLSTDINETFLTVTVTGASAFTVTVAALTNAYVASSGSIVEVNPKYWTFVPHTDNNYYNEYTIVYNELKGGFTTFLTPKPLIYNQWTNSYLTPRPISIVSLIYEDNTGTELTWYDQPHATPQNQTERGYIEGVVNRSGEETFWAVALRVLSDIIPIRIEFFTKTQESYLDSSEIETFEDYHESCIKEDSTVTVTNPTGLNDSDTSLLYGRYLKVKTYFSVGVYQRLVSMIVKILTSTRDVNK